MTACDGRACDDVSHVETGGGFTDFCNLRRVMSGLHVMSKPVEGKIENSQFKPIMNN